jgi:hypothetical protein
VPVSVLICCAPPLIIAPPRLAAGMSPAGGSPLGGSPTASRLSSRSATPQPGLRSYLSPSQLHQSLINRLGGSAAAPSAAGSSSTVPAGQAGSRPARASEDSTHQADVWHTRGT